MIGALLPASVATAWRPDDAEQPPLHPEEEAAVARSVDSRRREFTTVRGCAREALGRLGLPASAVPSGPRGEPLWPQGVRGSMTHCKGYRAAAVTVDPSILSLGMDAEPALALPDGFLPGVTLPEELDRLLATAAAVPGVPFDRLLFSAKETVFKVWYPLVRRGLEFEEADVTVDPDGTFTARLLVPPPTVAGRPLDRVTGRWLVRDGLLMTAAVHRAPEAD
ncbi:4'-phosphopantetheinyl transferase family protein [Streptomyces sp. BI20]|uniref:4'-phosphopantetheinyl transferase family protein n=1 Tax=Streptomyces sp. BI20 TaxID=3403460 RepID=UPI003C76DEF7